MVILASCLLLAGPAGVCEGQKHRQQIQYGSEAGGVQCTTQTELVVEVLADRCADRRWQNKASCQENTVLCGNPHTVCNHQGPGPITMLYLPATVANLKLKVTKQVRSPSSMEVQMKYVPVVWDRAGCGKWPRQDSDYKSSLSSILHLFNKWPSGIV